MIYIVFFVLKDRSAKLLAKGRQSLLIEKILSGIQSNNSLGKMHCSSKTGGKNVVRQETGILMYERFNLGELEI